MTFPQHQVIQIPYQNPDATKPLHMPVLVMSNTADEVLDDQIRSNTARDELTWLHGHPKNDDAAIMVGGGASAADFIPQIRELQAIGGKVFAMNAASQWLRRDHDIEADYQCILDAQEKTSKLVDTDGPVNIIASQAHPKTMNAATAPLVWHLELGEIENLFPKERVKAGGYCLLAGGASCGNSAMAVAYALGHRTFHVYGYDCSHREKEGHAYQQNMNDLIPTMEMEWAGKTFLMSVSMRGQVMAFQVMAGELKRHGCTIEMYGDGLLQHIYRTKTSDMTECDKYRTMWNLPDYRDISPGENCVSTFLAEVKPDGLIVDFGCGTGRASIALKAAGYRTMMIDFADNCRDQEALELPFVEWDLTNPLPMTAPYGFCTDVMEHIPTKDVNAVIRNIMAAAARVFFQISTVEDNFGALLDLSLHLTVKPPEYWYGKMKALGYDIEWREESAIDCRMVVVNKGE